MKEKFIDLGLDEEIALKCVNLFKSELKTQLKELKIQLFNYVNWYNNRRIHGYLNYYAPAQFKESQSEKKLS